MTGSAPTTAVVTVVSGRTDHLRNQRIGLEKAGPDLHVIVGMGERPRVDNIAISTDVLFIPVGVGGLPLAAARNRGAARAIASGAEVLVFLDVDCIPSVNLVKRYQAEAIRCACPSLLCGVVHYLPPPGPLGYQDTKIEMLAPPHPARPQPMGTSTELGTDFGLFWSLSFALTTLSWGRLGGFDETFVGYGAEDTDFALRANSLGAELRWIGGAAAFHQWHPPSRDDQTSTGELVANANRFRDRHGYWPMLPWLEQLAAQQRVEFSADRRRLTVIHGVD